MMRRSGWSGQRRSVATRGLRVSLPALFVIPPAPSAPQYPPRSSRPAVSASAVPVHDVHVSHMRIVVEDRTVAVQVRLFHDDLQDAVRRAAGSAALTLSSAAGDSAFVRYFARSVGVSADGARLVPRLLQARDERDVGGVAMRVYTVELAAARPVRRLALRDALLFEHFRDQQNLVVVLRMPGERRTSLFFAAGDTREQVVPE